MTHLGTFVTGSAISGAFGTGMSIASPEETLWFRSVHCSSSLNSTQRGDGRIPEWQLSWTHVRPLDWMSCMKQSVSGLVLGYGLAGKHLPVLAHCFPVDVVGLIEMLNH